MAEPRKASGKEHHRVSLKCSDEHIAGSKADKPRRRKSIASQFAHPLSGENVKERQQRARENREARKKMISDEYKFIMGIVASYIDLEVSAVEEFIVDSEEAVYLIDSFLKPKGRRTLLFFYQDFDQQGPSMPHKYRCSLYSATEVRVRSVQHASKSGKVLLVTDGLEEGLTGTLVYCAKSDASKELKMRNIAEEACFGMINVTEAGSLIPALRSHLSKIYLPAIKAMTSWGELTQTPQGKKASKEFVESLDSFVHFIDGAHASVKEAIKLHPCEIIDVRSLEGSADYQAIANNPELLAGLDELVHAWCKQIEQVLAESEQMRREADDTGPMAELEHWKMRMAKFNSLVEQIKGADCKAVIRVLLIAKSKTLKFWRELDCRITDAANEAKDNVKFLYTLEKECDPLYHSDPVSMIDCIPKLINAIQMIHSISRYCNTSQRMTSLFIKVTNQMVTACKNYVTDRGINRVWDQPRQPLIEKLKACLRLNQEYQKCFQRTKKRIAEDPTMKPFEFSEMYIFGKFDTFCKRLNQIIEVLNALETFSVLSESKIEGIETISNRFQHMYSALKKKPYDPLDHRKPDFEADFFEFRRHIIDIQKHLQMFMSGCFEKIVTIAQSLELLGRFEKLGIPSLKSSIEERYACLLHHFGKEVEVISKMYQRNCENPPVHRDVPPISGRISWARQLMRRIRNPMDIFERHPSCLKTQEAIKVICNFNQLAAVLVEFEILYHKGWLKQVEIAKTGLQASLLVRHPDTGELYVNCDPQLIQLIRETECMMKMKLPIPETARLLYLRRTSFKSVVDDLKMMLEDVKKVRAKIPNIFMPLMAPHMQRVEGAISPGITMLNWNSLNIPSYISNVYSRLREVDLLVKQVNDIRDARIDAVLREISETVFCELPKDDPWTIDEFIAKTQMQHCGYGVHAAWKALKFFTTTVILKVIDSDDNKTLNGTLQVYQFCRSCNKLEGSISSLPEKLTHNKN